MRTLCWIVGACAALVGCGGGDGGDGTSGGGFSPVPGAPALQAVIDVWAFSPTDVWFLDGSATVHRFDGSAWTTLATPSSGGLGCIFALSPSDVFLCAGSEVLHYDGAAFQASDVTTATGLDGLRDLWAASPKAAWVVGDDGIVGHYDGSVWKGTIAGSPFKASIWGSGPADVYALDTFGLVHFDGSAWTEVSLDAGGGEGQVWGTSASDVWVMSGSSQLVHYDGAKWTTVDTGMVGDLVSAWGPAAHDLWAAGSAGAIAHYDGSSWQQVSHQQIGAPYLRRFVAVHGTSSDDVWLVGSELGQNGSKGLIYHRGP